MSVAGAQYVVLCTYRRGALSLRDAAIADHLSYLRENRYRLRFAGPLLNDDDGAATGSLAIVEIPDRTMAADFIQREAFHRAGMFDDVEIVRFESAVGLRQVDLIADPERQMFLCCWRTAPAADLPSSGHLGKLETDASTRVLERGALVSDDGARVVGGLLIVEVAHRSQAEQILAVDIGLSSATDARKRLTRWRFGQALSGAVG